MSRLPGNSLTQKRQVGAVCPGSQVPLRRAQGPMFQGRDSSLWKAYSLRNVPIGLVPGSSADLYLAVPAPFLKLLGGFFEQ